MKHNWRIGDVPTAEDFNEITTNVVMSVKEILRRTISVPATGWTAAGNQHEKTIDVVGLLTSDDVDIEVTGAQASKVVLLGGRQPSDGKLTLVVVAPPAEPFDLLVVIHRIGDVNSGELQPEQDTAIQQAIREMNEVKAEMQDLINKWENVQPGGSGGTVILPTFEINEEGHLLATFPDMKEE